MPAVHAADRIRLDRECQVLMHPHFAPPDPPGIWVVALKWSGPVHLPDAVAPIFAIDPHHGRCRPRVAGLFVEAPPPQMMRHRDNSRADSFSDPDARHEISDARTNL